MRKLTWAIAVLPMLITAAAINFLPEKVPTHYGITGKADSWGSRYELFIFPVMILISVGIFELFAHFYGKKTHSGKENAAVFRKTAPIIAGIMCVMQIVFIVKACADGHAGIGNLEIDMNRATAFLMGIMLIAVSNYMPKTRRNSSIGFRCGWTLYNDTTWQKSNRFAAAAMTVAGICTIVSTSFAGGMGAILLLLGYLTAALTISMVYAKRIYDEEKEKENKAD